MQLGRCCIFLVKFHRIHTIVITTLIFGWSIVIKCSKAWSRVSPSVSDQSTLLYSYIFVVSFVYDITTVTLQFNLSGLFIGWLMWGALVKLTLQVWSPDTRMFLAARSLWIKPFLERYSIPDTTCWQNLSSSCWWVLVNFGRDSQLSTCA